MKTTVWTSYLTSKYRARQTSKLACLLSISIIVLTLSSIADEDEDTNTDLKQNVSDNADSVAKADDELAKSDTSQKNLARIVTILRFEARLAVQEAARARAIAEQEAGISRVDVAKERAKERYETELSVREAGKERAKERYQGELALREAAIKRAKELYEAELAAQEAAKKRAKERYDAEIATQEAAQERAKEVYESEIAAQEALKERAMTWTSQYDENALKVAVFGAIDSNRDDVLSRAEFETAVQILDNMRRQSYPGMKEFEDSKNEVEEESDGSDEFAKLDTDEDGVLSQSEFDSLQSLINHLSSESVD